ncbi:MAG: hypothetical protein KatS3mg105_3503 [Gemmatales bacterium]|nr:MAG: hypothetical protein KatS3mg105_3503 [Gemmatales bacterium]
MKSFYWSGQLGSPFWPTLESHECRCMLLADCSDQKCQTTAPVVMALPTESRDVRLL